jgi:PTS system cellobiose-specific IIC component
VSARSAGSGGGPVAALEQRFFPILRRWADEPHMVAVRDAVQMAFYAFGAWTVIAFFLLPPGPLLDRFFAAYHIGFGFMGLALAVVLPDRLARQFGINRLAAVAVGLLAFLLSLPANVRRLPFEDFLAHISATSLFLALLVGLTSGEIMRRAARRLHGERAAIAVGVGVNALLFGGLALAHVDLGAGLIRIVQPLVSVGDTLPALLVVVFLQTLLWAAGIHGPAFLAPITTPVYLRSLDENAQAILHHQPPPHVVTMMIFTFIYPGGSGATLPVAAALLRARVARLRRLGYASLVPSLCNINEPLIFGLPIAMNPGLVIPFIGAPLILAAVTYLAQSYGLVAPTSVWLPSAIPAVFAAWLTTKGDWRALVLLAVNIAIAAAIWLPFYAAFERTVQRRPDADARLVQTAEAIRAQERRAHLATPGP